MFIKKSLGVYCITCAATGKTHRVPYKTPEKAQAALEKLNLGLIQFIPQ